jgi:uncharacterized protein
VRLYSRCGSCMLFLVSLWSATATWAATADPMRAPTAAASADSPTVSTPTADLPGGVFDAYLRFFQRIISPVDGARSNMYPTGSDYARQAIKKHGALLGIVLTTERLMHEGNEGQRAPRIRKYGLWRIYDPVEANDWWWQNPDWVYQPRQAPTGER